MTFILADSFETVPIADPCNDMALRGWGAITHAEIQTSIFHDGTQAIKIDGSKNSFQETWGSVPATDAIHLGFWFYKDHEQVDSFVRIETPGGDQLRIELLADDNVRFNDTVLGVLGTSTNTPMSSDVWHYVEIKYRFNNSISTDDCIIKIDGVEAVNLAAATDTRQGQDTIDKVTLYGGGAVEENHYFDSFIMWDTQSGDDWNDFRGIIRCETKVPDANGQDNDFVGSDANSVDNYLQVDETKLHDGDSTYNESPTVATNDSYNFPDIVASDVQAIVGVQVAMISKKTGAGAVDLTPFFVDGGSDHLGTEHVLTNGTYTFGSHMYDEDPQATAAWTAAKISSGHFGLRVT